MLFDLLHYFPNFLRTIEQLMAIGFINVVTNDGFAVWRWVSMPVSAQPATEI